MNAHTYPTPSGDTATLKCACADLWAHPGAQLLAGPALRPGGRELTGRVIDQLDLRPGIRVLDIGSGTGVSLSELTRRDLHPFGVDYSLPLATQASECSPVAVGDAEALPYRARSFDAVLAECVLSALPDKPTALSEVRRVLAPGGHFVLTDMTVNGELPEPLQSIAAWAACVGGALSPDDYGTLLLAHGFVPLFWEDASSALRAFVAQVERRLAMLRGAMSVGLVAEAGALFDAELKKLGLSTSVDGLFALAEMFFEQAEDAIDGGKLGYIATAAVAS